MTSHVNKDGGPNKHLLECQRCNEVIPSANNALQNNLILCEGTLDDPTCMIPEVYNIMNQDDAYPVLEDVVQPAVEDMTQPAAESTLQSVEFPEKCMP